MRASPYNTFYITAYRVLHAYLYCIVLYYTVLYYAVLNCTVLIMHSAIQMFERKKELFWNELLDVNEK